MSSCQSDFIFTMSCTIITKSIIIKLDDNIIYYIEDNIELLFLA